ncbi:MAG: HAD family phosphatase [Microbacteriaceae bacterium]|nr:HAD family phosphatase [Microbacteriaceae bacterium]
MADAGASAGVSLPSSVSGIIFDMDDTLVDSERAWIAAELRLRAAHGVAGSAAEVGGTMQGIIEGIANEAPGLSASELEAQYLELLQEELADAIVPMPGAAEFLDRLASAVPAIPLAVASNSPTDIVRYVIGTLGWEHRFQAMLGVDDVEHPKPAPDLYLLAAERIGADAAQCVVFEDSFTGATAAKAAGAFTVAVGEGASRVADLHVTGLGSPQITSWFPTRVS